MVAAVCTLALMRPAVDISVGSVSDIPRVRDAFLSLHEHHRRISTVMLTGPDERAWSERVSTYEQYFAAGRALLHVARIDGGCVGYAFTVLHAGSDDTFPLGAGYAELSPSRSCPARVVRASEAPCWTPSTRRFAIGRSRTSRSR